jgi:thymidylate kinase
MNKFFVIEGIDCSGKSTICKRLAKDKAFFYIKTPPKILHKNISCNPFSELSIFLAGLFLNAETIKKQLKKTNVICDRYLATFIVDSEFLGIKFNYKSIIKLLPKPNKTINLTANYETIVNRLNLQDNLTEWEQKIIKDKKIFTFATKKFETICDTTIENENTIDKTLQEIKQLIK